MKGKIFIGLDAGCREHTVVALTEKREKLLREKFVNDHEGCERFLEILQRFSEEDYEVWVGAEGAGGYLSPFDTRMLLAGFAFVGFHPCQVKNFRKMFRVHADKEDHLDAELIAEMLHWMDLRGQLKTTSRQEEYFQALREAARAFEAMTGSKVMQQNRLIAKVREYWPELMVTDPVFQSTDAKGLLEVLAKYPTPEKACRAGVSRIEKILRDARSRKTHEMAEKLIEQAHEVRGKVPVSEVLANVVSRMAQGLLAAIEEVAEWEKTLRKLLADHPFGNWLLEQEGLGVKTAGCFLGEVGNLDRFETDAKMARYAGNGAVKSQSGAGEGIDYDGHRYSHRLKRVILLIARSRSQHHAESKEYLARRLAQGDKYWAAIKKLARHILKFLWKAWQEIVKKPTAQDAQGDGFSLNAA